MRSTKESQDCVSLGVHFTLLLIIMHKLHDEILLKDLADNSDQEVEANDKHVVLLNHPCKPEDVDHNLFLHVVSIADILLVQFLPNADLWVMQVSNCQSIRIQEQSKEVWEIIIDTSWSLVSEDQICKRKDKHPSEEVDREWLTKGENIVTKSYNLSSV